jgi:hypothetical protein
LFGGFFFRYGIYIFPLFSFHVHFCWGNQIKIWCLLDFFSVKRSNKHLILIIGAIKLKFGVCWIFFFGKKIKQTSNFNYW